MTPLHQREPLLQQQYIANVKIWKIFRFGQCRSVLAQRKIRRRQALLRCIHTTWIKGLLEPLLTDTSYIPLQFQQWPIALQNQWDQAVPTILPPDTCIIDAFDQSGCELLLLGEPGAGKTTLLLELLRDLLERAEQDPQYPIPVVCNLSSWVVKCLPLEKWLAEELQKQYQIGLCASDQLILLLDGLDEVREDAHASCLQAINAYREAHAQVPMVICCRYEEYTHLNTLIQLRSAVLIQPLTDGPIDAYLSGTNGWGKRVGDLLYADPVLRGLVHRPLLLRMLVETSSEVIQRELSKTDASAVKLQKLLAIYVQHLFELGRSDGHYSVQGQKRWLTWMARYLCLEEQSEFYLEQMQPHCLPTRRWKLVYYLLFGLVSFPVACLFYGLSKGNWGGSLSIEIAQWWFVVFLMFVVRILPRNTNSSIWKKITFIRSRWLLVGLGELCVEVLNRLSIGSFFSFIIGLGLLFICEWMNVLFDRYLPFRPDQGIQRVGRYAVSSSLLCILLLNVFEVLVPGLSGGLFNVEHFLLYFGLTTYLGFGGGVYIRHFLLRFTFWCAGSMPWHAVTFLDDAVKHHLLYRIGSGYIFRHRWLLNYFAAKNTDKGM